MALYHELAGQAPAVVAHKDGDAAGAMADAAQVIEARYEFPYLAHAALSR
jgi:isoquinoline 1-oxidoreductase beta subunit